MKFCLNFQGNNLCKELIHYQTLIESDLEVCVCVFYTWLLH